MAQLVEALRVRDEPRARALIEDARGLYSDDSLVAEVERLAREDARMGAREADQLASDPEPASYYLDDSQW